MAERYHVSSGARLEEVRGLAAFMVSRCEAAGISPDAIMELELALVEAANNIVVHGYEGRADGEIGLSLSIGEDLVELELTDGGPPVPEGALEPRPVSFDAESGRGMGIIYACVDRLDYRRTGGVNHLLLAKRVDRTIRSD